MKSFAKLYESLLVEKRGPKRLKVGININDKEFPWTDYILSGRKTIETRRTNSLKNLIGKRVGLIKTGLGPATLIGAATLGEPIIYTSAEAFNNDQDKHMVAPESTFYIQEGGVKYGYPLLDVERFMPEIVRTRGIVWRDISKVPQIPY